MSAPAWPTWPFTRLTPAEMSKLLDAMKQQRLNKTPEALL